MRTTRIFTISAMLTALYVVLGMCVSINLGNMKLSLDALPIIIAALYLGPVQGACVGFFGGLTLQMLQYGLTPTTILWLIPPVIRGLVVGIFGRNAQHYPDILALVIIISSILVTASTTLVMMIDSQIYGYYSHTYVFGALLWRIIAGIASSFVYAAIVPDILKKLRQVNGRS